VHGLCVNPSRLSGGLASGGGLAKSGRRRADSGGHKTGPHPRPARRYGPHRCRAKREKLERFGAVLSESQGQNPAYGGGAARAEDAQGTPTQSHISPSILVYEDICARFAGRWSRKAVAGERTVVVTRQAPTRDLRTGMRPTAAERRGKNLKGLEGFYPKGTARIWP